MLTNGYTVKYVITPNQESSKRIKREVQKNKKMRVRTEIDASTVLPLSTRGWSNEPNNKADTTNAQPYG